MRDYIVRFIVEQRNSKIWEFLAIKGALQDLWAFHASKLQVGRYIWDWNLI